jgi:beta-lactamase family protein
MRDFNQQNFLVENNFSKKKKSHKINWKYWVVGFLVLVILLVIRSKKSSNELRIITPKQEELSEKEEIIENKSNVFENLFKLKKDKAANRISEQVELDTSGVVESINFITKDKQGSYGWYVESLVGGESYGQGENGVFTAASINKLPIVAKFLIDVESGVYDLEDVYKLVSKDIEEGSGTMQYQKLGTRFSYNEVLGFIGKYSDNTATNALVSLIGEREIRVFVEELGMEFTSIKNNTTTAYEMGRFWARIDDDEIFLKEETKDYFLTLFIDTEYESRIPAGVPGGVKVSHKIGNQVRVWSDCGVVMSDKPYVICVLTDEIKESEAGWILPEISRLVWEFEKDRI